jgi:hypothetical protein
VRAFFFFNSLFSAFLGVSRQGDFENTEIVFGAFPNPPGKYFFGGQYFFRVDFFSFSFDFLLLRWLSASRCTSVRGTQKRD